MYDAVYLTVVKDKRMEDMYQVYQNPHTGPASVATAAAAVHKKYDSLRAGFEGSVSIEALNSTISDLSGITFSPTDLNCCNSDQWFAGAWLEAVAFNTNMYKDSSPGWPYCYFQSSKIDWLQRQLPDLRVLAYERFRKWIDFSSNWPSLEEFQQNKFAYVEDGFSDYLLLMIKDEPTKRAKIDEGMPRLIKIVSIVNILLQTMLWRSFYDSLNRDWKKSCMYTGVSNTPDEQKGFVDFAKTLHLQFHTDCSGFEQGTTSDRHHATVYISSVLEGRVTMTDQWHLLKDAVENGDLVTRMRLASLILVEDMDYITRAGLVIANTERGRTASGAFTTKTGNDICRHYLEKQFQHDYVKSRLKRELVGYYYDGSLHTNQHVSFEFNGTTVTFPKSMQMCNVITSGDDASSSLGNHCYTHPGVKTVPNEHAEISKLALRYSTKIKEEECVTDPNVMLLNSSQYDFATGKKTNLNFVKNVVNFVVSVNDQGKRIVSQWDALIEHNGRDYARTLPGYPYHL